MADSLVRFASALRRGDTVDWRRMPLLQTFRDLEVAGAQNDEAERMGVTSGLLRIIVT